jgi:hypothetical protein
MSESRRKNTQLPHIHVFTCLGQLNEAGLSEVWVVFD